MLRRKTVYAALVLAIAAAPAMAQSPVNKLEWRGLNPQPEPPSTNAVNRLQMLGLNPQPEPPSANAAPPRFWIPPRP